MSVTSWMIFDWAASDVGLDGNSLLAAPASGAICLGLRLRPDHCRLVIQIPPYP